VTTITYADLGRGPDTSAHRPYALRSSRRCGGHTQYGRSVETILADWGACVRELETADDDTRPLIDARIAELRTEHEVALAIRNDLARDLGRGER
jgi:hypothetical protein